MYCKQCGKPIPDKSAFCKYCGKEIDAGVGKENSFSNEPNSIMNVKCPVCGARDQSSIATYCKKCGSKLNNSTDTTVSVNNDVAESKGKNHRSTWLIIAMIAVVIVVVLTFVLIRMQSPKNDDTETASIKQQDKVVEFENTETNSIDKAVVPDDAQETKQADETHEDEQIVISSENQNNNQDLYQQFINDQVKVDGKTYSETFADLIESGRTPKNYYFDVDEDGKDELLVDAWYGFEIYDIKDDTLYLLAFGGGTADMCRLYRGNGHVYIAHFNFGSVGWECLTLERYDGQGNIAEFVFLYAEYEGDTYTEDGVYQYAQCDGADYYEDFVSDNKIDITKNQYVSFMDSYTMIQIEEMKKI